MDTMYCQSCGMPMANAELHGTNADGTRNEDYCKFCYVNGSFTSNMTMDEMIEFCVPHLVAAQPGMSSEDARKMMQGMFPQLKRWKL